MPETKPDIAEIASDAEELTGRWAWISKKVKIWGVIIAIIAALIPTVKYSIDGINWVGAMEQKFVIFDSISKDYVLNKAKTTQYRKRTLALIDSVVARHEFEDSTNIKTTDKILLSMMRNYIIGGVNFKIDENNKLYYETSDGILHTVYQSGTGENLVYYYRDSETGMVANCN